MNLKRFIEEFKALNNMKKNTTTYVIRNLTLFSKSRIKEHIEINLQHGQYTRSGYKWMNRKESNALGKSLAQLLSQIRKSDADNGSKIKLLSPLYEMMHEHHVRYFNLGSPYHFLQTYLNLASDTERNLIGRYIDRSSVSAFLTDYSIQNGLRYNLLDWIPYLPEAKDSTGKVVFYPANWTKPRVISSLGKLVRKIYPSMDDQAVQRMSEIWMAKYKPQEVFFAESSDDVYRIYCDRDHLKSCMSGNKSVRAYDLSLGDYKLAYTTDTNLRDGGITARCWVREEPNKGYIRVYGDARLGMRLQDLGYGEPVNWNGAKLLRIQRNNELHIPYIDYGNQGSQYVAWNIGDIHVTVMNYDDASDYDYYVDACSANGVCYIRKNTFTCSCCGSECSLDEDEEPISDFLGNSIGSCCEDEYLEAFTSQGWGNVHHDNCQEVIWRDGNQRLVENSYAEECCYELCSEYYNIDTLHHERLLVQISDGDWILAEDAVCSDDVPTKHRAFFVYGYQHMHRDSYEEMVQELEGNNDEN